MRSNVRKSRRAERLHATGAIVLIVQGLQALQHFRMIMREGARAIETLLLARPVADENRPLRMWIRLFENSHGLERHEGAGAVVGCARRSVPRIEVGRQ